MTAIRLDDQPINAVQLPRDEMAFRARYRELLLRRELTTVFRPGDRIFPSWRGYSCGEIVSARIIRRPGSDELGVPPQFEDLRIPIRIVDLSVAPVETLESAAFAGSSPDVHDRESLIAHLEGIYERPLSSFGDLVTRIAFVYVE